ncbi:MAG: GFA family protein [Alphaproteobacteria bacterium]|nr:MAG: GFA family protein [Alphaproteobacteria bacterium]
MSINFPLKGGCACGAIEFECHADPVFFFLCHCVDCRKATGSVYAPNVWFYNEAVKITKEPAAHLEKSIAGDDVRHEFCPDCGTPIGMSTAANPKMRGFRASCFEDLQGLEPIASIWISTKLPWEKLDPSLPQFETQPTREEFMKLIGRE